VQDVKSGEVAASGDTLATNEHHDFLNNVAPQHQPEGFSWLSSQ